MRDGICCRSIKDSDLYVISWMLMIVVPAKEKYDSLYSAIDWAIMFLQDGVCVSERMVWIWSLVEQAVGVCVTGCQG